MAVTEVTSEVTAGITVEIFAGIFAVIPETAFGITAETVPGIIFSGIISKKNVEQTFFMILFS